MKTKTCCPLWAIITAVVILAGIAFTACLVLKKLHMLRNHYRPMGEENWSEDEVQESDVKVDGSGVRYTNDQDFV